MIDQEVISYLNNDSALTALLGASAGDPKIYPLESQQGSSSPYVIYNVPSDGGIEENIKEISMSFDVVDSSYIIAENIRNRISALLDLQDQINNSISSTAYLYFTCKRVGGTEFKEQDLDLFHRVSIFDFKYVILPEGDYLLTEDGQKILTEDGQGILLQP